MLGLYVHCDRLCKLVVCTDTILPMGKAGMYAVPRQDSIALTGLMLSCLGTATDLLDIPRQMTCMNPACTCRIV